MSPHFTDLVIYTNESYRTVWALCCVRQRFHMPEVTKSPGMHLLTAEVAHPTTDFHEKSIFGI